MVKQGRDKISPVKYLGTDGNVIKGAKKRVSRVLLTSPSRQFVSFTPFYLGSINSSENLTSTGRGLVSTFDFHMYAVLHSTITDWLCRRSCAAMIVGSIAFV